MNLTTAKKIIEEQDLQLAISRECSFFLVTAITKGYVKGMKQKFGFSYQAIAVKGKGTHFTDYLNIERLATKMENFLKENDVNEVLNLCKKEFGQIKINGSDPLIILSEIQGFIVNYFTILGLYNVFWRYLTAGRTLPSELMERIGRERNEIAHFYPKLDQIIAECSRKLGSELGFEEDSLLYLTVDEMQRFIETKQLPPKAKMRKDGYFYILTEDDEEVFTGADAKELESCFSEENIAPFNEIRGQGVFPGKVTGMVVHLSTIKNGKIPPDFILVTNMTHPNDLMYIDKSLAVITEEGSLLCHAAITCRELKKPCIVGTNIATKVLKDGDLVEVDAERGIVRKLNVSESKRTVKEPPITRISKILTNRCYKGDG